MGVFGFRVFRGGCWVRVFGCPGVSDVIGWNVVGNWYGFVRGLGFIGLVFGGIAVFVCCWGRLGVCLLHAMLGGVRGGITVPSL